MSSFWMNPWFLWACVALFYAYQFILRTSASIMATALPDHFVSSIGLIGAGYYITYTAMQIFAGFLLDHFNLRKIILFSITLCAIGILLFGLSPNPYIAALARCFMGVGSSFGFLSCFKIAKTYFKTTQSDKSDLVASLTLTMGMMGGIVAGGPLGSLIHHVGWRESSFLLTGLGVLLLIFLVRFFRISHEETQTSGSILSILGQSMNHLRPLLVNTQLWLIAVMGGLTYMTCSVLCDLFGASFAKTVYNVSQQEAGTAISMVYLGMAFGAPAWATIMKKTQNYKWNILIGLLLSTLIWCLILWANPCFTSFQILLWLLGFTLASQFSLFSMATNLFTNPEKISGTVGGFHNMMSMLSGVVFPIVMQAMLPAGSTDQYLKTDYQYAFCLFPLGLMASALILFFMKDNYHGVTKNS